jgi:DNA-binding response OmpR family regulator
MKVFLVEDDDSTREMVQFCLETSLPEIQVSGTNSGIEALSRLKDEVFDVVLLDLGLPDIDGLEALEQLRQFSQVPVLILSARTNPDTISRSLNIGASAYITKPFHYETLVKQVQSVVRA